MYTLPSYVYRTLFALSLVLLAPHSARNAMAADGLLTLAPMSSARFNYLTTIQRDESTWIAYGGGTQIAPDRVSVWGGATSRSNFATFTRVGLSLNRNDGAGWRQVSDQPLGPTYVATLSAQLNALQEAADSVDRIGDKTINGVATTHYQIWLKPGRASEFISDVTQLRASEREQLHRASYKVDLWIGQGDQRLYRQLVTLTIPTEPATTVSTLLMFTNFDDPSIAIDAPTMTVPRFEPGPCHTEIPEGVQAECGDLVVLADRSQPDGPTLRLAIIRLPATSPDAGPTPLVYLAGGPGQAGSVGLPQFTSAESPDSQLRGQHTLLFLDQRGTGDSQPSLTCPEVAALNFITDESEEETQQRTFDAVRACHSRWLDEGEDLTSYNSAENAADINDLRIALGFEQLDLYGVSYGTRLALTVMRDFPQAVRSVIIGSVLPPQADLFSGRALAFHNSLENLFTTCANDPMCNSAFPNLRESFSVAVARFDAQPVMLQVRSLADAQVYPVRIDGQRFVRAVYFMLLIPSVLPLTPALIDSAAKGDHEVLTLPYALILNAGAAISDGMTNSVNCSDEIPFLSAQELQDAQQQILPELRAETQVALAYAIGQCEIWNVPPASEIENQPVVSDIPTLILSGQFDPITPPSYGQDVARTLSHSVAVDIPGSSHDPATYHPCGISIMQSFLQDPTATPDTSCLTELQFFFAPQIPAELITLTSADDPAP